MFKKLIAITLTTLMLFVLSGCGEKEQSKTFNWTDGKTEISLTYYYKDDVVTRQSANNKINYAALGIANKQQAMQRLRPLSEKYQAIKGATECTDYQDTYATETLDVDYSKADRDALQQMQGSAITGDAKDGVSMSKSQQLLESRGFKEVK